MGFPVFPFFSARIIFRIQHYADGNKAFLIDNQIYQYTVKHPLSGPSLAYEDAHIITCQINIQGCLSFCSVVDFFFYNQPPYAQKILLL